MFRELTPFKKIVGKHGLEHKASKRTTGLSKRETKGKRANRREIFTIFILNNSVLIIVFCRQMNPASQALQTSPCHQPSCSAKKRRTIFKSKKTHSFQKSFRRGGSFSKAQNPTQLPFRTKPIEVDPNKDYTPLFSIYERWVEASPKMAQQAICSLVKQIPTLPSINQLFSLSSQSSLSPSANFEHLLRYAKICSLIDHPDHYSIFLFKNSEAALAIARGPQTFQPPQILGLPLSKSEAVFCEKREIFMEKLRNNELKYDASLGRMSQISKELAFSYRAYLQNRTLISSTLNYLLSESPPIEDQLQQASSFYARLLISKNLKHTFEDCQLDYLNYFALREYIEADRVPQFQSFSNFQQFQKFIQKRKPKRLVRRPLATACSVCLSDYHQLSNPLKHCQACGLRAHRLCFSFQNKKCGYCAYQKLERPIKQEIQWCVFCQKAGLMVIKVDERHYAHGFCLLVHGFWTTKPCILQSEHPRGSGRLGQQQYPDGGFNVRMQIEFKSPNPFPTISSHPNPPDSPPEEQSCDFPQSRFHNPPLIRPDLEKWENQLENNTHNNDCLICGLPAFHNCWLACISCGKHYHSFCAFLSGFKLTIDQGYFKGGEGNLPVLDCCSADYSQVGWNRRFKLNYKRCAYETTGQFPGQDQLRLWLDSKDQLLQ